MKAENVFLSMAVLVYALIMISSGSYSTMVRVVTIAPLALFRFIDADTAIHWAENAYLIDVAGWVN